MSRGQIASTALLLYIAGDFSVHIGHQLLAPFVCLHHVAEVTQTDPAVAVHVGCVYEHA